MLFLGQDGSCSCGFSNRVHIMAVQFGAGLNIGLHHKQTNLSVLRCKARSWRKQGHKRGLDQVEMCAPDSTQAKHIMVNFACYVTSISHCIRQYSSEARNMGVSQRSCAIWWHFHIRQPAWNVYFRRWIPWKLPKQTSLLTKQALVRQGSECYSFLQQIHNCGLPAVLEPTSAVIPQ